MNEKVKEIKKKYEKEWLSINDVVAVGIGNVSSRQVGLIISVIKDTKKIRRKIPHQIDGIDIKIQETGEIKAL